MTQVEGGGGLHARHDTEGLRGKPKKCCSAISVQSEVLH